MKETALAATRRIAQEGRRLRAPIVVWLVYECSRYAFFCLARRHGLLLESGVDIGTLLLGVWVLVLRFAVLFYVPFAVVYRLAKRLWLREPVH